MPSWREVFIYFLMLGFINIGGPVAQITMMYNFQAFLAGASAAVVGVIIVVSLDLIPAALVDIPTMTIALIAFLVIIVKKVDVAKVALGAMAGGIVYAAARGLY